MTELATWFRQHNIRGTEVALKTGYALGYVYALLNGQTPLTDSAKFRLMAAYPELSNVFLHKEEGDEEKRCICESVR